MQKVVFQVKNAPHFKPIFMPSVLRRTSELRTTRLLLGHGLPRAPPQQPAFEQQPLARERPEPELHRRRRVRRAALDIRGAELRCDKIEYPSTDQWGSFKAQQKLHFKAFFHAVH